VASVIGHLISPRKPTIAQTHLLIFNLLPLAQMLLSAGNLKLALTLTHGKSFSKRKTSHGQAFPTAPTICPMMPQQIEVAARFHKRKSLLQLNVHLGKISSLRLEEATPTALDLGLIPQLDVCVCAQVLTLAVSVWLHAPR
jgi:hypothetical protein